MALVGAGIEVIAVLVAFGRKFAVRGARADGAAGLTGAAVLGLLLGDLWLLEGAAAALSATPQ